MQISQLALVPLVALGGFAVGHFGSAADDAQVANLVSRDGFAVFNVVSDRVTVFEVPKGASFVMTDIEIFPVQGRTLQCALYEHPHDKMPFVRISGEFLDSARLFGNRGQPKSEMRFEAGSKIVLGPNRTWQGSGCFAYHVRGRLVD